MGHTKELTHVSLCAGYGGIDLGLRGAIRSIRTVCFVEIEAFCIENLVAKIESGWLDPAPVFSNLKTFPWRKFAGRVDILSGGFPCQPFSAAGRRAGDEDPRHLWPHIVRGIRELEKPPIVFFENVEGIISSKLKSDGWSDPKGTSVLHHVLRELERLGYRATAGVFSAREIGAPHQRKRVFILGCRADLGESGRALVSRLLERGRYADVGYTHAWGSESSVRISTGRCHEDVSATESSTAYPPSRGSHLANANDTRDTSQRYTSDEDRAKESERARRVTLSEPRRQCEHEREPCVYPSPRDANVGYPTSRHVESTLRGRRPDKQAISHKVGESGAPCPSPRDANVEYSRSERLQGCGLEQRSERLQPELTQSSGVVYPAPRGAEQYPWEPPRVTVGNTKHNGSPSAEKQRSSDTTSDDCTQRTDSPLKLERASQSRSNGDIQTSIAVGNPSSEGLQGVEQEDTRTISSVRSITTYANGDRNQRMGDTDSERLRGSLQGGSARTERWEVTDRHNIDTSDARLDNSNFEGLLRDQHGSSNTQQERRQDSDGYDATTSTPSRAVQGSTEPSMGGNPDGIACGMGYAELCESVDNYTDELRLLGNGVVPQCAEKAFKHLWRSLNGD